MKEGKFVISRNDINEFKLYSKPYYYLVIWVYLVDHAKFIKSKKEERGTVKLSKGVDTIVEAIEIKSRRSAKQTVSSKQVWKVLHFLVNKSAISLQKVQDGLVITIVDYKESQTFRKQ